MNNIFMEEFKKRLTKGIIAGVIIAVLMLLSPFYMGQSVFADMPWYLVPVVLIVTVLYGTGWAFAFNLVKKGWRKFARGGRDGAIKAHFNGSNPILSIVFGMLWLVVACFLAFVAGNIFMVCDFVLAKNGKAPISVKFKFDSDMEYSQWQQDMQSLRSAVEYNDIANDADAERRLKNKQNLDNIERGFGGEVTTTVRENGEKVEKETKIY